MNWFYLVVTSIFVVSISNILQKVLMKDDKSDPISYTIVFCFILGIFNTLFSLIHGFSIPSFSFNLVFLFLGSLCWAIATVLVFKALQLVEASEVTILTSIRAIITIFGSMFLLHEVFNLQKTIGVILILGSVVW